MTSIEFCIGSADLHFKVTYPNNRNIIHGKDDKSIPTDRNNLKTTLLNVI